MFRLKKIWNQIPVAAVVVGFLSMPATIEKTPWKFSMNQYGIRETYINQKSDVFGIPCMTRLRFTCTQDSKGATGFIAMEFTVSPFSKIKGFDFGYFEGPDAPGNNKKLMRISLTYKKKQTRFQVSPGGWVSAEIEDGFVFGAGTPTRDKDGYMRKVVEAVLKGAESIEVDVVDGADPSKIIAVTFPIADGKERFQALMRGIK